MKRFSLPIILILAISLLLTSCNMPRDKDKQTPTLPAQTIVAITVEALLTQSAAQTPQVPPTQETLPPSPSSTNTMAVPTLTTTPASPTPTPIPCDRGSFVTDVTIPDGTQISPGTTFTKTWRIKNNGSCSWTTGYKLVFVSGNAMEGPASIAFTSTVPPQETVDLSVTLKAPSTPGDYEGFWMLENASGVRFGLGSDADKQFWVKISSGNTPVPFAVTSIGMTSNPTNYIGVCPVTITITGAMTVSGSGTVTYYWDRSDGTQSATQSLKFNTAGTQTITYTWTLGSAGESLNGWVRVYNDHPNHQYFKKAEFTISCSP